MGVVSVYLNNINPDNVNFDEDNPKFIIHLRLIACCNRYKQSKAFLKQ